MKTPHRRAAATAVTTIAVAGIVLATPLAASAHVGVSPDTVTPDESAVLTFSFTHGCENSPTTALRISVPEGLASVSPTVDAAWDVAVERGGNGLVTAVTYTAVTPIPSDLRGAVSMAIRPGEDPPETLAFPVEQRCEVGAHEWVQIAEDGQDPHALDAPAPVVRVADAVTDATGHGAAGNDADADHASEDAAAQAPASGTAPDTALGTTLGAAGLVAGLAALVVSVLAFRRRA